MKYKVTFEREIYGYVGIEADSKEEAIRIVMSRDFDEDLETIQGDEIEVVEIKELE